MKHRKLLWESSVLMLCVLAGYILQGGQVSHQPRKANAGAVPAGKPAVSYAKLPLSFEANQGQTDARVKFLARGPGYTLFLTSGEVALELQSSGSKIQDSGPRAKPFVALSKLQGIKDNGQRTKSSVLRLKLVNANQNAVGTGASELPGKANYFIGNDPKKWRTNVPTYSKVKYEGVYPGVDLLFYGNQRQLEHDFVVAPDADAGAIEFRLEGSKKVSLDADGNLDISVGGGEVRLQRPLIYQEGNGTRREIPGGYVLKGAREVGFNVGAYDHSRPLVIDPVLAYATYLGGTDGSGFDWSFGIAVDSEGNAYVTGLTYSDDFPTTPGAFLTSNPAYEEGGFSPFVSKLNPSGSALVYSTYLGGCCRGTGSSVAVDSYGYAYVLGSTLDPDFLTTPGAFQTSLPPCTPTFPARLCSYTFVTKLNPSGSELVYSTFLGGAEGGPIIVDSLGNAYVTGDAGPGLPTTAGAFQTSYSACPSRHHYFQCSNAFVAKLNPSGSALVYSTYLAGSGGAAGADIAIDNLGNAYVTGTAGSDFPTTAGAFQTSPAGSGSAFLTKLNNRGSALIYSTYLGGSDNVYPSGVAVDFSGDAYVTGNTDSSDFPTTPGAFQTSFSDCSPPTGDCVDPFVTKLNNRGSALVYSTYLGAGGEFAEGIVVDALGDAYVVGSGGTLVTVLNPSGSALDYTTTLSAGGLGIAIDTLGNFYVTVPDVTGLPTTPGAFQTSSEGDEGDNVYVAKFENTPHAQLVNLTSTVENLVTAGTIDPVVGRFLLEPLNRALSELDDGQTAAAIRDLGEFVARLRHPEVLRVLKATEARTLIEATKSLITELRR